MARAMKDSRVEWIGEIPEGWDISKIKFVADFEPKCDFSMLSPASIITYTPMENIKNGYYVPNTAALSTLAQTLTAYQENDIVMAKVTPCFENGNIAVMNGLSSKVGLGSSELFVFRAKAIQTRFLFYWLQNIAFVEQAKATMTGTGGLKRVSPQFVRNCVIHNPPSDEQQRIANFLDAECARIDAVIEKTRASIEEYKKLKQSVITEAVTKGIRPGRKMKDSGIEWVGKIPDEWSTPKVGSICTAITDYVASGSFASLAENVEYLDEPDYAMLVRTADVSNKGYSPKPVYIDKHAYDYLHNSNLYGGEILLPNIGASVGDVYLVPILYERMSLAPNAIMMKTKYRDKFYYYYFLSKPGRLSIEDIAQSTAQAKFNKTDFRQIRVVLPSDDEQREVAEYLDKKTKEIDLLLQSKNQIITELESYKKSLIFEYVTGKKCCSERTC